MFIDFVTGLPIFTNWKDESYDWILVIIDRLTKMIYYKPVGVIIGTPGLVKIIVNIIMQYYGLLDLIVTNWGLLFTPKFWYLHTIFLVLSKSSQPPFTCRPMAKLRGRILSWRLIFKFFSIMSKITKQSCFQWLNLLITM